MFAVRTKSFLVLATFAGLFTPSGRVAAIIQFPMDPIPNRVATADVVAFGKVTAQEKNTERRPLYQAKPNILLDLQYFELTTTEVIKGKVDSKTIRIAIPMIPSALTKLKVGDEGCFALTKHFEREFYVLARCMFFDKAAASYDKETRLIRHCAELRNDPEKGLRLDRYLTACVLLYEYSRGQTRRLPRNLVEEPVDPKLSKLILQALADADWSCPNPTWTDIPHPLSAARFFLILDTKSKSTWPNLDALDPKYAETVKAWLKDHADTARVQRRVVKKDE